MVRGSRSFRMMMGCLLALATLVLLGTAPAAQASSAVFASGTDLTPTAIVAVAGIRGATGSLWAAPATSNDGVCGGHGGASRSSGCCSKVKCPLTHSGIAPVSPLPKPLLETATVPPPSGLLFKGIGTPPALRPPRAST